MNIEWWNMIVETMSDTIMNVESNNEEIMNDKWNNGETMNDEWNNDSWNKEWWIKQWMRQTMKTKKAFKDEKINKKEIIRQT